MSKFEEIRQHIVAMKFWPDGVYGFFVDIEFDNGVIHRLPAYELADVDFIVDNLLRAHLLKCTAVDKQ